MNGDENRGVQIPERGSGSSSDSVQKLEEAIITDNIEIKWQKEKQTVLNAFKKITSLRRLLDSPRCWYLLGALLLIVVIVDYIGFTKFGSAYPEPLDINLAINSDFLQNGEIEITGFSGLSMEELASCITIIPETKFTVTPASDNTGAAIARLEDVRNIAYSFDFKCGKVSSGIYYNKEFVVNGPALSVSIAYDSIRKNNPLILQFNEQVDIFSFERNLIIEPRTLYTLKYDVNRVTIVPDNEWNISPNYTATILAGYESMSGKQFAEHQVLHFKVTDPTAITYPTVNLFSSGSYVLNDFKDMDVIFEASHLQKNVPVIVETYKMPTLQKYRDQGLIYRDYDIPLEYLEKLDTNAYLLSNGYNHLAVPHFGQGGYIVSATFTDPYTGKERQERTGYLITDLSVYMQSSNRETTVWLNSSTDGASLSGYQVSFEGGEPVGSTDADGVLVVPHDEGAPKNSYLSVYDSDGALVYYDTTNLNYYGYHREMFYSYLFLDRSLYKPEDTVCFWGFVKPFRNNRNQMPGSVTVRFDPDGLNIEVEAAIDANGVFTGEIPLERIKSSHYYISAEFIFPSGIEGEPPTRHVFESAYVSVKDYVKPSYTLSSSVDRDYYGPKDNVTATISAAFFDGTPLSFFPLEVSYYDQSNYEWIRLPNTVTDELGNAVVTFPAHKGGADIGWDKGPRRGNFRVEIASDGETTTHVGSYEVFPSDVLLEAQLTRQPDGKNLALTVRSYQLDMNSPALRAAMAESKKSYYYLDNARLLEIARGAPVDVDMEISLRWDYYDNHNIRHRYRHYWNQNPIHFSDNYSLNYITDSNPGINIIEDPNTKEKKVRLRTGNGVATVTDLIYLNVDSGINFERDAYAQASISYKDGLNNSCSSYAYYPDYSSYREDWEDEEETPPPAGYSFQVTELATGNDITPATEWYYRSVTMGVGGTARFSLLLDGMPVETQGKIFYSIIHDGLYEYHITDQNYIDIEFKQDYIHEVNLVAVYFDGQETRKIKQININADMNKMALNIEITPDKESYRPGDQVRLTVKATDIQGKGVAGNLCVAVVDEAIFALSEQYIDVLSELYGDMYGINNYVRQYFTSRRDEPEEPALDGGKGGGDGAEFYDSYRSNFKDTAAFYPTQTDAGGNATVVFNLPDNTTSWRITAVEVGKNMTAGQSKSNIISTLPFFVKPVISPKYIDGDDFSMLVQGHGTLLSAGDEISYTVTVTGDGVNQTQTTTGKAYRPVELNFGKLPIGSYKVVSRAQYSGYSDTVELNVSVIKSNLELVIHKSIDISDTLDISAVRYPVTLTFYNKENEAFISSLNSMFGHYCMQTSQRVPRFVAKRALRQSMPDEEVPSYIQDTGENLADMQNADGGIGAAVGADSDPLLTTYVMLAAKDQFNLNSMTRYFNNQLETLTDPKMRAACYLGLAAIGEIQPQTFWGFLENDGDTLDVKAYYIAGLAYLNETETARKLYDNLLAPHINEINTRNHNYSYYNYSAEELAWERDAAAIWIAATRLEHPDADAIALHFANYRWRIRTLYECMIYVSNYNKEVRPVSFSYSVKGQIHQADLGYIGRKVLVLSKSDLESLRFISYPEDLKAVAYYVGEPAEIGLEQSENMSIQKTVRPLDQNTYEVSLKLSLTENAPAGQYDISDWVPSNSRLYKIDREVVRYGPSDKDTIYLNSRSEGQNLYFSANLNPAKGREITIKYEIRVTYTGEAVLDTTYVIHGDTGENCNTEKTVFRPEGE